MVPPTIQHTGLSTSFTGIYHPVSSSEKGVWQFRGIKYANVPARFRQSTLNEKFPAVYDASNYGPKSPQVVFPLRIEETLIGLPPGVASNAEDIFDEFECLNLNITMPAGVTSKSNLPVLVNVHGGGCFTGSNSDWWNDGGSIVKRSIDAGKPIVHVNINFRLSVLGFIGSDELIKENGPAEGSNFGLRDINTAIAWVARHIQPFGGSPSSITIYGESGGSLAVHNQLHSLLQPQFSKAIMQSLTAGAPPFSTPETIAEKSATFAKMKEALKISTVAEMQAVPFDDLLKAYQESNIRNGMSEVPMIDDQFFTANWHDTFTFKGPLMLGTTANEATVSMMMLATFPPTTPKPEATAFITPLAPILGAEKADAILQAYGITTESTQPFMARALEQVIEDLMWYIPHESLARHARAQGLKVTEYGFEQLQPFTGPFKGTANHSLDLAYLHGDPRIFDSAADPEGERALQKEMQDCWIAFAYGEEGGEEGCVRAFGPEGKVRDVRRETFVKEFRREHVWRVWEGVSPEQVLGVMFATIGHLTALVGRSLSSY